MPHMSLKTPIVLIIFNRPDCVKKSLECIAKARPTNLFVVADGPREGHPTDFEKCRETREIVDSLSWDWPCEIKKNYSDTNLGCGYRPATGISWAFEHVESAIILEDDCLPNDTFFRYAEEMLELYNEDDRVMCISGTNNRTEPLNIPHSYCFSNFPAIWGWATWKRAWDRFDIAVTEWGNLKESDWIEKKLSPAYLSDYFRSAFDTAFEKKGNTSIWDYQWNFAIWSHDGLCIFPRTNLVTNIGWGPDGTHTFKEDDPLANRPTQELEFPLQHPPKVETDTGHDRGYVEEVYKPRLVRKTREAPSLAQRLRKRLQRLFAN